MGSTLLSLSFGVLFDTNKTGRGLPCSHSQTNRSVKRSNHQPTTQRIRTCHLRTPRINDNKHYDDDDDDDNDDDEDDDDDVMYNV
ncbi:hypothetical protein M0804_014064 [Polistes exclamans]|nr:hypothetical protein M0804_014065 [Polistes exclamans]KAI4475826.1 hypothetical protein M0804_014064 [Polistes exclamans]